MKTGRLPLPRTVQIKFWDAVRTTDSITAAAHAAGISHETGRRWFRHAGGVIGNAPRPVSGRYLSLEEREEIALAHAAGHTTRQIAALTGRHHTTISRELARTANPAATAPDTPNARPTTAPDAPNPRHSRSTPRCETESRPT